MIDMAFAVPGDLATPTGGYAYDRRVLAELPAQGVQAALVTLPGSFPNPPPEDVEAAVEGLRAAPGEAVLVDGLAFGALPSEALARVERPLVALVHHPLGLEAGLSEARRTVLLAGERTALAQAKAVVVTSMTTKRLLTKDFGVPDERITVAEPGTDPTPRAQGSPPGAPVHLLAVGAVSPRKGYDGLMTALAGLPGDLAWHLTIAGALDRDPGASADLRRAIASAGLQARVDLAGAVSEDLLDALYAHADLFVSPSLFEGYGMALAEALARGLPLVASTGGAAAETVPDGAALKVPPGDVAALRDALRRAIADAALRRSLADAAWVAGQRLPRWSDTTAGIAAAVRSVLS